MKHFTVILTLSILFLVGCTQSAENKEAEIDNETQLDNFGVGFKITLKNYLNLKIIRINYLIS